MPRKLLYLNPTGKMSGLRRATYEVVIQSFDPGASVTIDVYALMPPFGPMDSYFLTPAQRKAAGLSIGAEILLGSVDGIVEGSKGPDQGLAPVSTPPPPPTGVKTIGIAIGVPATTIFEFKAPVARMCQLIARVRGEENYASVPIVLTHSPHAMFSDPAINPTATYPFHFGNTLKFYNDGSKDENGTDGYLSEVQAAITNAREFVYIADWSFHPDITLMRPASGTVQTVAQLLINRALAHPEMIIAVHTWRHPPPNIPLFDIPNNDGEKAIKAAAIKMGEKDTPKNLLWRATMKGNISHSHHQKYVICDIPDPGVRPGGGARAVRVFMGGLDLTQGRHDWPEHKVEEALTGTVWHKPGGWGSNPADDWYNAETNGISLLGKAAFKNPLDLPRQPWHDIACRLDGPAAWDVLREFLGRWNVDPFGDQVLGDNSNASIERINKHFLGRALSPEVFVQQYEPHAGPWSVQICRSLSKRFWGAKKSPMLSRVRRKEGGELAWELPGDFEHSIQNAYTVGIAFASKFIYIESQYFISSGDLWDEKRSSVANKVAQRIVERVERAIDAKQRFHCYLIVPMFPEGGPTDLTALGQRMFQWRTFGMMWKRIHKKGVDPNDFLTIGFLAEWNPVTKLVTTGDRAAKLLGNRRYQVYVHSKHMIVDDYYTIIGSANLNERSTNGDRDTEIVASMWPDPATGSARNREVEAVTLLREHRNRLFSEHFNGPGPNFDHPEALEEVRFIQQVGDDNWWLFVQGITSGTRGGRAITKQGHFCRWPVKVQDDGSIKFEDDVPAATLPDHRADAIPDSDGEKVGLKESARKDWTWPCPGPHLMGKDVLDFAE